MMPGYLIHEGATVWCAHAGQARPLLPSPRVRVAGQQVATVSAAYTISGCTLPPPPNGNGPCLTAQWCSWATRVRVGGEPVLLGDSQAVCAPTGASVNVVRTQTRVRGI